MSDMPPLQFDRPEFHPGAAPAGVTCTACKKPVVQSYYEANGHVICSTCREQLTQQGTAGGGGGRMLKGFFQGLGVALLGGAVWWAVRTYLHFEIAIISIAIGWGVGTVVRRASGNRGGLAYQVLAVALTYFGICSNYVPDVIQGVIERAKEESAVSAPAQTATDAAKPAQAAAGSAKPAATNANAAKDEPAGGVGVVLLGVAAIFGIALAAPFLQGFNIIGLLIIAFGLWRAWKLNQRTEITINGPFSVAPAANG
jgi:hypothetical protein